MCARRTAHPPTRMSLASARLASKLAHPLVHVASIASSIICTGRQAGRQGPAERDDLSGGPSLTTTNRQGWRRRSFGPPQPTFLTTPCMPGLALRSLGTIRLVCGSPCTRRAKASGPSRPTTCMTHYQIKERADMHAAIRHHHHPDQRRQDCMRAGQRLDDVKYVVRAERLPSSA